jgi:hypothetical protein
MYLKNTSFLPEDCVRTIESFRTVGDGYLLNVSDETAEQFRDAFTVRLAKAGFDASYNLSSEGKVLEDLIDRFGLASS